MHIYGYFLWTKLVEIELMGQAHKLSLSFSFSYSLSLPPYGSKAQNPKYMFFPPLDLVCVFNQKLSGTPKHSLALYLGFAIITFLKNTIISKLQKLFMLAVTII